MDFLTLDSAEFYTIRDSLQAQFNRAHGYAAGQGRTWNMQVVCLTDAEFAALEVQANAGSVPVTLPSGESFTGIAVITTKPWPYVPMVLDVAIMEIV